MYGWTREDFAQLMAIGKSHFEGWDIEGSEEESHTAPAVLDESEEHSMHRYEVENTLVSD